MPAASDKTLTREVIDQKYSLHLRYKEVFNYTRHRAPSWVGVYGDSHIILAVALG